MEQECYSFPPRLRLRKPAEYKKVFSNPLKFNDQYFTLLVSVNELEFSRLGLAIAKKNIRKAVDRNILKRAIRESFRMHQQQLGTLDIVVLARKEALNIPLVLLRNSLQKQWLKIISRCNSSS
ncbi:MAG: ribonuclease P protein component [Methylococcaceae bacterium]|nr:ribonuclease P protein component [Methylococcaceae bacterium]